jgi:phospholipid/cholesterol/gamma-HCH transport system substrate-binding protein
MYEINRKLSLYSLRTGLVLVIILVIISSTIFFSGNIANLFTPKVELHALIDNIQGLRPGSPVWLYGYEIGTVKKIRIVKKQALVTLSIKKDFLKSISQNAEANIMTMGILGDKFVELKNIEETTTQIKQNDTIYGRSSVSFDQITEMTLNTMAQLDSTIAALSIVAKWISSDSGTISKILKDTLLYSNLYSSLESIKSFSMELENSNGSFQKLIKSPELYKNINSAARQLSIIMNRIEVSGNNPGLANALLNDSTMTINLQETIVSLRNTTRSINDLVEDFKKNPKKYLEIKIF